MTGIGNAYALNLVEPLDKQVWQMLPEEMFEKYYVPTEKSLPVVGGLPGRLMGKNICYGSTVIPVEDFKNTRRIWRDSIFNMDEINLIREYVAEVPYLQPKPMKILAVGESITSGSKKTLPEAFYIKKDEQNILWERFAKWLGDKTGTTPQGFCEYYGLYATEKKNYRQSNDVTTLLQGVELTLNEWVDMLSPEDYDKYIREPQRGTVLEDGSRSGGQCILSDLMSGLLKDARIVCGEIHAELSEEEWQSFREFLADYKTKK